jgi:hypothetical protein
MAEKVLTLTLSKTTKGTHVYADDSADAAIPSVYVKKSALPDKPPVSIELVLRHSD